jgi:hypothetical protein
LQLGAVSAMSDDDKEKIVLMKLGRWARPPVALQRLKGRGSGRHTRSGSKAMPALAKAGEEIGLLLAGA